MAKTKYEVKYKTFDKKTGRQVGSGFQNVQADGETNAIGQIKKIHSVHDLVIVAVTPKS